MKRKRLMLIQIIMCLLMCLLLSGCALFKEKDEYFSHDGEFNVEKLNSLNEISGDSVYYYKMQGTLYQYSFQQRATQKLLDNCGPYVVCDGVIYYADGQDIYCFDKQTEISTCVSSDVDWVNLSRIAVKNGYLYVYDYGNGSVYRSKLVQTTDLKFENIGDYFKLDYKTDELVQITLDGWSVEGYCSTDRSDFKIIFMYNMDSMEYMVNQITNKDNMEILVDGRRVTINRDEAEKAETLFMYQIEGEEQQPITCLCKEGYTNSILWEHHLYQSEESQIIGLINVTSNSRGNFYTNQGDLKRDMLFRLDIETGESEIIYDAKNRYTRIVGYRDGTIYLFKDDYTVYSQPLNGGELTPLLTIPRSEYIDFDWYGDTLIVLYKEDSSNENYQIATAET